MTESRGYFRDFMFGLLFGMGFQIAVAVLDFIISIASHHR